MLLHTYNEFFEQEFQLVLFPLSLRLQHHIPLLSFGKVTETGNERKKYRLFMDWLFIETSRYNLC